MILFGHPLVAYESIYKVAKKIDFESKPKEAIFLFEWNEEFIEHCRENKLRFIVYVESEKEAIVANALGAEAVVTSLKLVKQIQELAEYYLFDTKVALLLEDDSDLDKAIKNRVDMSIFKSAII